MWTRELEQRCTDRGAFKDRGASYNPTEDDSIDTRKSGDSLPSSSEVMEELSRPIDLCTS